MTKKKVFKRPIAEHCTLCLHLACTSCMMSCIYGGISQVFLWRWAKAWKWG